MMASLQASLLTPLARLRGKYLGRIVARVDAHAAEFSCMDDDGLRAQAREVRFALRRRREPRGEDVALCFALIREASERVLGRRHYGVQLIRGYARLAATIAG